MKIFFEDLNILISTGTFCLSADGFQGLSKAFHFQLFTFFASLKLLTNFENDYY